MTLLPSPEQFATLSYPRRLRLIRRLRSLLASYAETELT